MKGRTCSNTKSPSSNKNTSPRKLVKIKNTTPKVKTKIISISSNSPTKINESMESRCKSIRLLVKQSKAIENKQEKKIEKKKRHNSIKSESDDFIFLIPILPRHSRRVLRIFFFIWKSKLAESIYQRIANDPDIDELLKKNQGKPQYFLINEPDPKKSEDDQIVETKVVKKLQCNSSPTQSNNFEVENIEDNKNTKNSSINESKSNVSSAVLPSGSLTQIRIQNDNSSDIIPTMSTKMKKSKIGHKNKSKKSQSELISIENPILKPNNRKLADIDIEYLRMQNSKDFLQSLNEARSLIMSDASNPDYYIKRSKPTDPSMAFSQSENIDINPPKSKTMIISQPEICFSLNESTKQLIKDDSDIKESSSEEIEFFLGNSFLENEHENLDDNSINDNNYATTIGDGDIIFHKSSSSSSFEFDVS